MHPHLDEQGRWVAAHTPVPRLVILSGSGLSVESGLSLYRAAEGLWESHDVNQVCNIRTWKANAEMVHRFYDDRRAQSAQAVPNAGHQLLVDLETEGAVLVTQNVDTLLEQAGAQHVLHLHGSSNEMLCTACGHRWLVALDTRWNPSADCCPDCLSRKGVKPGVVFFGEQAQNYRPWQNMVSSLRSQDVVLTVGSSGEVVNPLSIGGPHKNWLANLGPSEALPEDCFEKLWYAPITQSAQSIADAWHAHLAS
jgi:NAD-dependent deacetylase